MSCDSREKLLGGGTQKDRKMEKQRKRETDRQEEEGRRVRTKEQERRDGNEKNCNLRKEKNKRNKREGIPKAGKDKHRDTGTAGSGLWPGFVSSSLWDSVP